MRENSFLLPKNMKLSLLLFALGNNAQETGTADLIEFDKWSKPKEHEIIAAYNEQREIVLSNPNPENEDGLARKKAFLHWHKCGAKPALPKNARDVVCQGNHCATICNQGHVSERAHRVRCKKVGKEYKFVGQLSQCVTCPNFAQDQISDTITHQSDFRKNLPRETFFCPKSHNEVELNKKSIGKRVHVKCHCRKQRGKKNCTWSRNGFDFEFGVYNSLRKKSS